MVWGGSLLSGLARLLVPLVFAITLAQAALAQDIPPYQASAQRQICGEVPILDGPAGARIGTATAGLVTVDGLGFGSDGQLYYHMADTTPPGHVATGDAPYFCNFAARQQPGAARFRAIPNSCHLIAASRRTLDEVNAFAAEYADFLPTMSVYRADNGWYAIALGQISLAAAPELLASSRTIPADSYCSDGANYVAVMDLQGMRFVEPVPALMPPLAFDCLTSDGLACAKHAAAIYPKEDYVDQDFFDRMRYGQLGCMAGDPMACEMTEVARDTQLHHALLTAWPEAEDRFPDQDRDIYRIGCDAGLVLSCTRVGGAETARLSGDPVEYLTAIQGLVTACRTRDDNACRELLVLLDKHQQAMGQPARAEDIFHAAQSWAVFCDHFGDTDYTSCQQVYRTYAGLLNGSAVAPERAVEMTEFIRKGCDSGVPEACVLYSNLTALAVSERQWGAKRAEVSCAMVGDTGAICRDLDRQLASDLPQTDQLKQAEFDKRVALCLAGNTREAQDSCADALSYYAGNISASQIGPVETALRQACTPDLHSGCETLAFLYSANTMAGENLHFTGINQPEKRLAALREGCRPGRLGLRNCNNLGEILQEQDDQQGAQDSYRTACNTVRMSDGASSSVSSNGACFNAGLHALQELGDRDTARSDFIFTCDNQHDSNSPYACKHLALMDIEAGAKEKDPMGLISTLQKSCYPSGDFRGDGEGCLYYGKTLLEFRDRLHWDDWEGEPVLGSPDQITDRDQYRTANNASYLFSRGCLSRWQASCAANDNLIADWINGAYPRMTATCQIRAKDQSIRSEKTCGIISYSRPQVVEYEDGYIFDERLYFWPDGDRTLVTEGGEQITLNGNPASFYQSQDGSAMCQQNPETGNSFCTVTDSADQTEG